MQRLVWSGPNGTITAHLWGGGGGGGGADSQVGGNGTGGGYTSVNFTVVAGDVIDVAVGGPGVNGLTLGKLGTGGAAGASWIGTGVFDTRNAVPTNTSYAPSTNSVYCSFLNTYGIWDPNLFVRSFNPIYNVVFPATGYYTFTMSADNYASAILDGALVVDTFDYRSANSNTVFVTAGTHQLVINAINTGGPGSVALMIDGGTNSYSGGSGGSAGVSGFSGGGGGGGGATLIRKNNTTMGVAGGGGGGGGGGRFSAGQTAPGSSGNAPFGQTSGQRGQDKDGDGAGGGGGGGGQAGGNGGATPLGDVGALAGSYGISSPPSQNPSGILPGGTNSVYYSTGIAQGGTPSQGATGGYAAIVIETGGTFVYNSGWQTAKNVYVRNNNQWQQVRTTYVNNNGVWQPVAGGVVPVFVSVPNTIGTSSRPYA